MSSIRIELIADTPEELERMVATISRLAPGRVEFGTGPAVMKDAEGRAVAMVDVAEDMGVADEVDEPAPEEEEPVAEEPKRGRGRPAGAKNKPKAEPDGGPGLPPIDAEPTPAFDAEAAKKLRDDAVKMLVEIFGRKAAGQKAVKELQVKWGVSKFVDVELEFAEKLHAEAKALYEGIK